MTAGLGKHDESMYEQLYDKLVPSKALWIARTGYANTSTVALLRIANRIGLEEMLPSNAQGGHFEVWKTPLSNHIRQFAHYH